MMKLIPSVTFCFSILFLLGSSIQLRAQCDAFATNNPVFVQTNCGGMGTVCTDLDFSDDPIFDFLIDGIPVNALSGCNFDTLRFYEINPIIAIASFAPYYLNNWCVNGNCHSTEFLYVSQLVDSMNVWDETGDWDYSFRDRRVVGGNPQNNYTNFQIEVIITNSQFSSPYEQQFLPTQLAIDLPLGLHLLEARNMEEQCSDSLIVNVVCTQASRLSLQLERNRSRIVCLETDELITGIKEVENVSISPQNYTWQKTEETSPCVQFNGRNIGEDVAQMVICDRFGICDTTIINIEVREAIARDIYAALLVGESGRFCVEDSELRLPSDIKLFESACESSPQIAATNYNDLSRCFDYAGLRVGQTTECLRVCDDFDNCDTLNFNINVVEPILVYDTLLVNGSNGSYCLDVSDFDLETLRIEEDCAQENSIFDFNPNTFCFSYSSSEMVEERTCVWLLDERGNASYIVLQVLVSTPVPLVRYDSIFVNQSTEICLDRSELPGQLRIFENICEEEAGAVEFFMTSENCIELTGLELGNGEGCFVLCDNFGYCDTTYLRVQVVPYLLAPTAEDDAIAVSQNTSVTIDVRANDSVFGGLRNLRIVVPPRYGQAMVVDDQIVYTPNDQNCTGSDSFQYEICNSSGCDFATVRIEVACAPVQVFSAMSPNGDGINDVFFIANLAAYPSNNLKVFNRYGALVYEADNYQNDWSGIWNGRILPDGTYFYLLELEVDGNTEVLRGYVELHR